MSIHGFRGFRLSRFAAISWHAFLLLVPVPHRRPLVVFEPVKHGNYPVDSYILRIAGVSIPTAGSIHRSPTNAYTQICDMPHIYR